MTGARLALLSWMSERSFQEIEGALLEAVEALTVEEHRRLFQEVLGEPWKRPFAYRWIRFESPAPALRLLLAGRRLEEEWRRAEVKTGGRARRARRGWEEEEERLLAPILLLAAAAGFDAGWQPGIANR